MDHKDVFFVLGDAFDMFEKTDGIMHFSHLLKEIEENNYDSLCDKIFVIGQGIHVEQLDHLTQVFEERKLSTHLNCTLIHVPTSKASSRETHKRNHKNIMVSLARAINDSLFEADLHLDDRSELLDDHITGCHLQGMVLMEAARQLFLTVTEQFFLDAYSGRSYYFVIHEMNTTFHRFAFPLKVNMIYEIIEKNVSNPEKLSFFVLIRFMQIDNCVAEVKVKFTASDNDRITSKERSLARNVLQQSRERVFQNVVHPHS